MATDKCIAAPETGSDPIYRRGTGRIVHFTDVHLALPYQKTGIDGIVDKVDPIVKSGADPGVELLDAALECAKKVIPEPNFFLYTGDSVIHEAKTKTPEGVKIPIPRTDEYQNKVIDTVMDRIRTTYVSLQKGAFFASAVGNVETSK